MILTSGLIRFSAAIVVEPSITGITMSVMTAAICFR